MLYFNERVENAFCFQDRRSRSSNFSASKNLSEKKKMAADSLTKIKLKDGRLIKIAT